jgi:hypothetical protein
MASATLHAVGHSHCWTGRIAPLRGAGAVTPTINSDGTIPAIDPSAN